MAIVTNPGAGDHAAQHHHRARPHHPLWREVIILAVSLVGLLVAFKLGAVVADRFPDSAPWLYSLSFLGPAMVVLVVALVLAQRLK